MIEDDIELVTNAQKARGLVAEGNFLTENVYLYIKLVLSR